MVAGLGDDRRGRVEGEIEDVDFLKPIIEVEGEKGQERLARARS